MGLPIGGYTWAGGAPQPRQAPVPRAGGYGAVFSPAARGSRMNTIGATLAPASAPMASSGGGGGGWMARMPENRPGPNGQMYSDEGYRWSDGRKKIMGGESPGSVRPGQGAAADAFNQQSMEKWFDKNYPQVQRFAEGGTLPDGKIALVGDGGTEAVKAEGNKLKVYPANNPLTQAARAAFDWFAPPPEQQQPPPTMGEVFGGVKDWWDQSQAYASGGLPQQTAAPATAAPIAPIPEYVPSIPSMEAIDRSFTGGFDLSNRPMASASGSDYTPQPAAPPPTTAPAARPAVVNAFTIGAPAADDRIDASGRFVAGAQTWARNLYQAARANPGDAALQDQARKAAQWASMTGGQRTAALAAGERAAARASSMSTAQTALREQQQDPGLWAMLQEYNRTGRLPGTGITNPPTGGRNLVSPYGTGYATNPPPGFRPGPGLFRSVYPNIRGYQTLAEMKNQQ